jgi:hypothetical protein
VYLPEFINVRISAFDTSNGEFDGHFATQMFRGGACDIAFTGANEVVFADYEGGRINIYGEHGRLLRTFGGYNTTLPGPARLRYPTALATSDNLLYVLEEKSNLIKLFE